MKINFCQIYVKPKVDFPFSFTLQTYLSERISKLASASEEFLEQYGADWELSIYISADDEIDENLVKGPTIFKKDKDVEYTIFLPYGRIMSSCNFKSVALSFLIDGVSEILNKLSIDITELLSIKEQILEQICSDTQMFKSPN